MRYSPSSSVVRLALFSKSSRLYASPGTTWSAGRGENELVRGKRSRAARRL